MDLVSGFGGDFCSSCLCLEGAAKAAEQPLASIWLVAVPCDESFGHGHHFLFDDFSDRVADTSIRKGSAPAQAESRSKILLAGAGTFRRCAPKHEEPILIGNTAMLNIVRELWLFLLARKKYWLLPIIVMLALLGGLVVLSKGSAIAPFIYTIF